MKKISLFIISLSFVALLSVGKVYAQTTPPVYEETLTACEKGNQVGETITIRSNNAIPETVGLAPGKYIFEVEGEWVYGGIRKGDAGYATDTTGLWTNLDSTLGISPGASRRGIISLISDMGTGEMGIVNWGKFNMDHEYDFAYEVGPYDVRFVVSDWWDGWYANSCNNQSCMTDNSGSLSINVYDCVERDAKITYPENDKDPFSGDVNLQAYLLDNDRDGVQWAVREGTCEAGTNTVMGNVDGFHDTYNWTYDGNYTQNFNKEINVETWDEGMYCFIFNPSEDAGESNIRLTREFYVETDSDNDEVLDYMDLCSDTEENVDFPIEELGVNRHVWYGGTYFTTLVPVKRGSFDEKDSNFSLEDTYGCSCEQILDSMSSSVGAEFGGHYKFGCSKSIIEDWIRGTYHVGLVPFESLFVPGTSAAITSGTKDTEIGTQYQLTATGTYKFANWEPAGIADATCSYRTPGEPWVPGSALPGSWVNYLELQVNGSPAEWGECNSSNTYTKMFDGTGSPFTFQILDSAYGDNFGGLNVDIIEDKWVNLR